ncbi:MAG TPA: NlpC/P60 family protein [Verrucomicrobiaceae bacterium]
MRWIVFLLSIANLGAWAEDAYQSPYSVAFTFSESDLMGDFAGGGLRGDFKQESSIAFPAWYVSSTQKHYTSWGPPARHFTPPAGLSQKSADWMRQRIIAVALRYRGIHYQHHHIPDWDPPADWPYKSSPLGHQSKGVDCCNFTAFVYNIGLGLKPTGETRDQSALTEVAGPGPGRSSKVTRIEKPETHADFVSTLKTGDLLFVKGQSSGEVTHVVIWVGQIGRSKGQVPLVIDSTGEGRKDENGAPIPDGVQLRPFLPDSWYCRSASHVLRLIPDGP